MSDIIFDFSWEILLVLELEMYRLSIKVTVLCVILLGLLMAVILPL